MTPERFKISIGTAKITTQAIINIAILLIKPK
jgi:hypothetical protein